ncbi:MAG: tetraacyldisaccharide 4'-kinase, partial [Acidobacteriota bacterium]|nr:tetraacyldisaccharide 4'-kinase [Acidobacteriota bacterium]
LRPSVVVVLETEIWPNLFRETRRTDCALVIVNGRISDRTADRYAAMRWFFRAVLEWPNRILVQSPPLRERFLNAGAPPDRVEVSGNLKYDFEPPAADPAIARFFGQANILIAASTTSDGLLDEEDPVIQAFRELPGWKLLLAPRKPERFDEAAAKLDRAGILFVRRSQLAADSHGDVLLLDSIGELSGLFSLARVVFMGGTLANRGGHNILEPAFAGKPIVIGPHMENFREMADDFRDHHAAHQISGPDELAAAIGKVADDPAMGERARACAESRRGATRRAVARIVGLHAQSSPCYRASLPTRLLLGPFSQLWTWVSASMRARDLKKRKNLKARVISVGNITLGGTGKTPMVLHLAERLRDAGRRPGILTRGYGRQSPHENLALEPGATRAVGHTGDEAQIFLRAATAFVGIGADRLRTGQLLVERYGTDVLILDDGFQHLRLARQVDIVLIDALDPFGDCGIVPLGRLREPLAGLRRAGIFIVTRSNLGRTAPAIENRLRELNPDAVVFRSRVTPRYWVDHATREHLRCEKIRDRRSIAFCGLGNPEAFWRTLSDMEIRPVDRLEFGDHHAYTPREIRRIAQQGAAQGIEALLTTEKDAVNLCQESDLLLAPLKLFWLKIDVEIENEAALLELLNR